MLVIRISNVNGIWVDIYVIRVIDIFLCGNLNIYNL